MTQDQHLMLVMSMMFRICFTHLLLIHFDLIRPKEWTSSYAEKSSRMDFSFKNFTFVIEVKDTKHDSPEKK